MQESWKERPFITATNNELILLGFSIFLLGVSSGIDCLDWQKFSLGWPNSGFFGGFNWGNCLGFCSGWICLGFASGRTKSYIRLTALGYIFLGDGSALGKLILAIFFLGEGDIGNFFSRVLLGVELLGVLLGVELLGAVITQWCPNCPHFQQLND
jgi:hypothetical protein